MAKEYFQEMRSDYFNKLKEKLHSDERAIVLKPINGKKPLDTAGLVDPRLFSGETVLYAVKDPHCNLWCFKYKAGILPPPLKQKFTGIDSLVKYAREYFGRRNMEIVEVVDKYGD